VTFHRSIHFSSDDCHTKPAECKPEFAKTAYGATRHTLSIETTQACARPRAGFSGASALSSSERTRAVSSDFTTAEMEFKIRGCPSGPPRSARQHACHFRPYRQPRCLEADNHATALTNAWRRSTRLGAD
jgi:hypothetical protein